MIFQLFNIESFYINPPFNIFTYFNNWGVFFDYICALILNYLDMKKILFLLVMFASFVACSKDDDEKEIDTTPISIYIDDARQLNLKGESVVSDNEFVAFVENDSVYGFHVGKTNIVVNGNQTIPVEVKGRYDLGVELLTEWGASIDYVKKNHVGGKLIEEDSETLAYEKVGDATGVIYTFKNGKLSSSLFVIDSYYLQKTTSFLLERFLIYPENISSYTFVGMNAMKLKDATTIAFLKIRSSSQLAVMYTENTTTKSGSVKPIESIFDF